MAFLQLGFFTISLTEITLRIDAHHHLWRYTPEDYGWIEDSMRRLQRDFLPPELEQTIAEAGVTSTIAVQARQSIEETRWLLSIASETPAIRGVVGWAPIASPEFPQLIAELSQNHLLKGLRHVVQAEPSGFLDDPGFNTGIATLTATGLAYDLLIKAPQLAETIRFVDRHPHQSFVLDHIAKPDIARKETDPWRAGLREIARRPNVTCKLSGMVTEASWESWTAHALTPYWDVVLDAFGPSRLMAGSDWPVLTLACGYETWWQIVASWIAPLSADERADIESGVVSRVYGLSPATIPAEHSA